MRGRFLAFALTFVALFVLTYIFLAVMDALPNPPATNDGAQGNTQAQQQAVSDTGNAQAEAPTKIIAEDIGLNIPVSNPDTTDVEELDNALLSGAVRYPTSAWLGVNGTVLIFGHSSYLPIVHNQNYKAFDGIQNLQVGQTISVYSGANEYRYSVTDVHHASATDDVVELPTDGKHLALVTCDSFGKKTDRFIVTADFAGVYPLSTSN